MTLDQLTSSFAAAGCRKLYAKLLAQNDNSKNQVYFAGAVEALNMFPSEQVFAENTNNGPSFKARLNFGWLTESGAVARAPGAQLILYAQYPEVRFSGFLLGCEAPPSELMTSRLPGRILFLGVSAHGRVVGYAAAPKSSVALEFAASTFPIVAGVFHEISLPSVPDTLAARERLLQELRRINRLGWIQSKQLSSDGTLRPCLAPQCGGFTLEAELGIPKNSSANPDFLGWEIKQHQVANFDHIQAGTITLMTPEPTGGYYREHGVESFVRKFGYPDNAGRPDRWNFGGVHKFSIAHPTTKLTLHLQGFDRETAKITDASGSIVLVDPHGHVAASWAFTGLLNHWSRKHTLAAYVPSQCRKEPERQYRYGHAVRLAQGTDSIRLLSAIAAGHVYYDPGIKMESASTPKPAIKRRSQFRIASKSIGALYQNLEVTTV